MSRTVPVPFGAMGIATTANASAKHHPKLLSFMSFVSLIFVIGPVGRLADYGGRRNTGNYLQGRSPSEAEAEVCKAALATGLRLTAVTKPFTMVWLKRIPSCEGHPYFLG
jgi:hypothetical protein